jgi:hypothetical protein
MILLTFATAIALSVIAAYYSIIGLAAIFTGAFWPIVIMGSVLEASKLVTASWLYRNWHICPRLLKAYLTSAVVILMIITSMGIFGFLSKAHIDSTLTAGANSVEIRTLNQQEKIVKERLDYLLKRAGDPETASARIDRQIQDSQKELTEINRRRLPLLQEETKLLAEVGPIKYIGDLVYGIDDADGINKAVRLVIMLIMVVFDPLAVLLLIAANMSMNQSKPIKEKTIPEKNDIEIPVFVPEPKKENIVEIEKNNLADIEIDPVSGITIPPIGKQDDMPMERPGDYIAPQEVKTTHISPGVYTEEPVKKLEPKYDYDAEYAFKEKRNRKDGFD